MKKLFIAIMAVAAAVSCSQELTVDAPKGAAIAFDNAFVENATRAADYTADNITDFSVYGFITKDTEGAIFTDQKVAGSNAAGFTYSPAQYWVGGATYSFSALVPYEGRHWTYTATNSGNGLISFNNQTAVANQDLLFAYATRTTPASITAAPEAVAFTFDHVLSRVKFSFVNGFGDGQNITLKVTNVNITNAYANGTLALENGVLAEAWTPADKNLNVAFGDVAGDKLGVNVEGETTHYYLIPAEDTYEVTFTVAIYQSDVLVDTYNRTATVTVALERGKSYDLQATLTANNTSDDGALYPIEFTVGTVNGWENYTGADVTVPEHVVATAAELSAAVAEGGNIVLTQDINLDDAPAVRAAAHTGLKLDNDVVIDGAGKTISTTAVRAIVIDGAKNVVLKNFTLNAPASQRGIQMQATGHNVTIENVKATSKNYTLHITQTCENATVVVNNCDLKGLNTVNVWATNSNVTINNSTLTCEDNNADEGYAVVYNNGVNTDVTVNGGKVVIAGSNAEGTYAGLLFNTDNSSIVFNGTEGDCTVDCQYFAINYGDYRYTCKSFAEALEAAKDGETIVLLADLTTDATLNITKSITLDLNGHTLTAAKEGAEIDAIWVRDNSEVVITGNGAVIASYDSVFATGTSKVTIENGTFVGAAEAVFAQANASVVINGGSFKSTQYPAFTLNLKDSARATASILVNGGKFYNFNPANNAAEGEGTNFCAAGKTVEQDGDWYIVK